MRSGETSNEKLPGVTVIKLASMVISASVFTSRGTATIAGRMWYPGVMTS